MRLIEIDNLDKLQLSKPMLEASAPRFAILSHTWGDAEDELSFQDMANISRHRHKPGYLKIRSFCALAKQAGYRYTWVDTVCIDKTSSAELSEAINSMYRWYSTAAVCYVFLQDLSFQTSTAPFEQLQVCRWFTRGWTLQELLAPKHIVFYDKNWNKIGDKSSLISTIVGITGIDFGTILGLSVKRTSVARRMSWASQRKTSRPEDLAYCLLGIFGINMPMLYGEGEKAFIRLQEEILRSSNDQSIFAWSIPTNYPISKTGFWGLLAPSASFFKDSSKYLPLRGGDISIEHSVTSRGVSLEVFPGQSETEYVLNCRLSTQQTLCTLPIARLRSGPNDFARLSYPAEPGAVPFSDIMDASKPVQIFVRNQIHEEDFEDQYMINYMEIKRLPSLESGYVVNSFFPLERYDTYSNIIFASPFPKTFCGLALYFKHRSDPHPPFMVALVADGVKGEGDCISHDVVGIFRAPVPAVFFHHFERWSENCGQGDRHRITEMLPGSVEKITRDGIQVWKLDDNIFVRVSVRRAGKGRADSIAVAEISVEISGERVTLGKKHPWIKTKEK